AEAPIWISAEPKTIINANELLDEEKNPLAEVTKALKALQSGDIVLIESDFLPSPLIDTFKEQGHELYAQESGDGKYLTYIRKR
ncbi:sulfurtransferase TusA family protein, partial [Hydrogenimonas sp.]